MTVEMEIDGRMYRATVARVTGSGQRVTVNVYPVDAPDARVEHVLDIGETDLGLSLIEVPSGRVIESSVVERLKGELLIQLPHVDLVARLNGRRRHGAGDAHASGEQRVTAPMPGRVVRVLVRPDDAVTAGQPLVVIEAMKMENALTALRDGQVTQVLVAEGASVESGRLLLTIS